MKNKPHSYVDFFFPFFPTFTLSANQDDGRLSLRNHLNRSGLKSVDPSNLSELNEIHHSSG